MIETIKSRRPKPFLPLALIAPSTATALPSRLAPGELRRLVAAMVD